MKDDRLPSLLLVGCGNMGGALWRAWLRQDLAPSVVIDRHLPSVPDGHHLASDVSTIPSGFRPDYIILAIKPARMEETLAELTPWIGEAVIVSVMAGRTIEEMRQALPADRRGNPIVRAMPNTPCEVSMGVTGAFGSSLSLKQKSIADTLLQAVGKVVWVEQEKDLIALTPLSGSGPAYVFLFAELLEKEAVKRGLKPDVARILARRTISGAGALLETSDLESNTLRENVTSPNGVTAAALSVFMRTPDGMEELISQAIDSGIRRTEELSNISA